VGNSTACIQGPGTARYRVIHLDRGGLTIGVPADGSAAHVRWQTGDIYLYPAALAAARENRRHRA